MQCSRQDLPGPAPGSTRICSRICPDLLQDLPEATSVWSTLQPPPMLVSLFHCLFNLLMMMPGLQGCSWLPHAPAPAPIPLSRATRPLWASTGCPPLALSHALSCARPHLNPPPLPPQGYETTVGELGASLIVVP